MREMVLSCMEDRAQAWSDVLLEAGALSVSVEDADGDTVRERPLFGEPGSEPEVQAWQRNRLAALLADGDDPARLLAALERTTPGCTADLAWSVRDVPDTDWVRLTQSQFGPVVAAGRIWIVPSWHRTDADLPAANPARGIIRIELDPGLAFGTGSHPTTFLCLEWLAERVRGGETVLDYGCGSGILSIAARLLGAGRVQAVDIDEQAVLSARENARTNAVSIDVCVPDALPAGVFEFVVANILSSPLKLLAPMLAARVAPGGSLVLSGVLERQADEVIRAYAPWIALQIHAVREGWACLAGRT